MKKALIALNFVFVILFAVGQDWNPYVNQGVASPDPLLPVEFNGTGIFSFHIGNNGNKPLSLIRNQEMTLVISLSNGIPGTANPLSAIGGIWADKFNWSYDASFNTFIGIQNQEISDHSEGVIRINYTTTVNSPEASPSNGFKVNIQPPPYSNGVNLTEDDDLSVYTFVRAKDFSDAPGSYGTASHVINVQKNPETREYENYIFLGHSVDPEPFELLSANADGDDNDGTDDEDGVIFPILVQGDTVDIQVIVTVHDFGAGLLNAWFDWNGDGDFDDSGEKIPNPVSVFESDTVIITVAIPSDAVTSKPVFSRFRLGNIQVTSPVGESAWGEVEDYMINILETPKIVVKKVLTSNADGDLSGSVSVNDILTYTVKIINNSDTLLNNLGISDDKLIFSENNCTNLKPGESCILIGTYKVKQEDLVSGNVESTITIDSDETEPIHDTLILFRNEKQ
jgi:hypothetical protein